MPVRAPFLPVLAAALAGTFLMGGAAQAQGVLLPPGEVLRPGAGVPGAAQPTPFQLFSPQQAVPQQAAPQASAPQIAAPQTAAPQASAPAPAAAPQAAAPQAVPLPAKRPASANAAPAAPTQIAPSQSASAAKPGPVTPGPVAPTQGDQDRAPIETIQKVSDYWNKVQVLSGNFVQVDPDGSRKTGDFYMQKPGRVRFEYNAPVPIELISNGQSVAVRDRKLNTQDITPLSQTPLRFLLADRVDLANDSHVVGTYQDNLYITVVMEEKVPMMGTYRLMLLFDAKTYALKQWIVTDPQGYDTSVAISNLDYARRPDPKLFVINFERMLQ
ncbi:outer-membrane lipoprotein carrier protein LolA [Aquabacter sp. CN5-332]|uniref:outer-membrane lipoprotein carrier protein LolA n=1 Tax=Aquabacter sp. CN5-332 TaxID=3156608 RepID=UPI0032B52FB6